MTLSRKLSEAIVKLKNDKRELERDREILKKKLKMNEEEIKYVAGQVNTDKKFIWDIIREYEKKFGLIENDINDIKKMAKKIDEYKSALHLELGNLNYLKSKSKDIEFLEKEFNLTLEKTNLKMDKIKDLVDTAAEEYEKKNSQIKKTYSDFLAMSGTFEKDYESIKRLAISLENSLQSVSGIEKRIDLNDSAIRAANERMDSLNLRLQDITDELAKLKNSQVDKSRDSDSIKKSYIEDLEKILDSQKNYLLNKDFLDFKKDLIKHNTDFDSVIKSLNNDITNLKGKIDMFENHSDNEHDLKILFDNLKSETSKKIEAETLNFLTNTLLDKKKEFYTDLDKSVGDIYKKIKSLNDEMATKTTEKIKEFETNISSKLKNFDDIAAELESFKKTNGELTKRIELLDPSMNTKNTSELSKIKSILDSSTKLDQTQDNKLSALETKLSFIEKQFNETGLPKKESQINAEKMSDISAKMSTIASGFDSLASKLERVERDMAKYKQSFEVSDTVKLKKASEREVEDLKTIKPSAITEKSEVYHPHKFTEPSVQEGTGLNSELADLKDKLEKLRTNLNR